MSHQYITANGYALEDAFNVFKSLKFLEIRNFFRGGINGGTGGRFGFRYSKTPCFKPPAQYIEKRKACQQNKCALSFIINPRSATSFLFLWRLILSCEIDVAVNVVVAT